MHVGQNKRINHEACSKGNDKVLSITRLKKGWWYECFRCGDDFRGFISLDKRSVSDTRRWLDQREDSNDFEAVVSLDLPDDTCNLNVQLHSDAIAWLYNMQFTDELIKYHDFGWSNSYGRLIMPVYTSPLISYPSDDTLIGWVGRNLAEVTDKRPKTLTKKQQGIGRIYFTLKGEKPFIVVVEDIPSAIKIHWAVRCSVVALLGSSPRIELLTKLPRQPVIMWLDMDMWLKKALKFAGTGKALGWMVRSMNTPKDPKDTRIKEIRCLLNFRF